MSSIGKKNKIVRDNMIRKKHAIWFIAYHQYSKVGAHDTISHRVDTLDTHCTFYVLKKTSGLFSFARRSCVRAKTFRSRSPAVLIFTSFRGTRTFLAAVTIPWLMRVCMLAVRKCKKCPRENSLVKCFHTRPTVYIFKNPLTDRSLQYVIVTRKVIFIRVSWVTNACGRRRSNL